MNPVFLLNPLVLQGGGLPSNMFFSAAEPRGFMIQFDLRIFFHKGLKPTQLVELTRKFRFSIGFSDIFCWSLSVGNHRNPPLRYI